MTSGVAVVTGASRGLGFLVARELLERGYDVAICARNPEELERGREQLQQGTGQRVLALTCDVTDAGAVQEFVDQTAAELGPVNVAIHVAGIIQVGPAEDATIEHFDNAIDIMLRGPIHLAWAVLPSMRERRNGRIGVVTSIGGMVAPPHMLPYAAAKFGAVGFTDGLAAELSGTGVTATTIVPGLMRTGSHGRATFFGQQEKEYAWFAPAASLPLVSMDAERAARIMVDGVLAGKPMVKISLLTRAAIRFRGLLPATTTRLMGVASRMLPAAARTDTGTVEGREAGKRLDSRVVNWLTTLGDRAAARHNEH